MPALTCLPDVISGHCPSERLGIVILGIDVILDGLFELLHGATDTPPKLLFGHESEATRAACKSMRRGSWWHIR